ncbi:MAG: branched-chain amino acid ABC transporter permease [Rhodobacteraceae bacterium]|nr:branched-chain amino acid ABC transporter permease [Paracoccaceae bacterium]
MNTTLGLLLAQDGIINGTVYAFLAVSLVLVFLVTRVLLVAQGEFVVLGAITIAQLQRGEAAGAFYLLVGLAAICIVILTLRLWRDRNIRAWAWQVGFCAVSVGVAALLLWLAQSVSLFALMVVTTLAMVAPMGPMLYWIAFRSLADSSILILLFAAMSVHYILLGLMLPLFGPEAYRAAPYVSGRIDAGVTTISAQSILVVGVFIVLTAALWFLFRFTMVGKELRAVSVNRIGARLVGISPDMTGAVAFALASSIGALAGMLIAPMSNIYYDSGFLFALKGFVGAVIGGLASFPLAAVGSILVGITESFTAFYASAVRDSIVFALLLPVLLYMSLRKSHGRPEEHGE